MKAAPFAYHAPSTLDEALGVLASHPDDAKVLAGGQSLVPMLALRLARFSHLVDLNRIEGLSRIERDGDELVIGATTRQSACERSELVARNVPLLARALPKIGHFQIRNRGTLGGSIAHADPASELPAVARCLDATMVLVSPRGTRTVPASDFFVSVWQTALEPDEILAEVRFPIARPRSGFAIDEVAYRTGDFAIAGVAVAVYLDDAGRIDRAALCYMGMAPIPRRATDAERAIVGSSAADIDTTEIAALAVGSLEPTDDIHATAAYRTRVARSLTQQALNTSLEEATHG